MELANEVLDTGCAPSDRLGAVASLPSRPTPKPARQPSDATIYRLAIYHCHLRGLIAKGEAERVTSRQLAESLDLTEETVRRDMSFVQGGGRPGSGYDTTVLERSLSEYLGLTEDSPIIMVGSAKMLEAVGVLFPAAQLGVRTVACFTEQRSDVGKTLDGLTLRHIADIARVAPESGAKLALIATEADWVQTSIDLLEHAGVDGFLLLTPVPGIEHADTTTVQYIRLGCGFKSLTCRRRVTAS